MSTSVPPTTDTDTDTGTDTDIVRQGWAAQLSWPGCDPETVATYVAAVDDESHLLDILSELTTGDVTGRDRAKIGHVNKRLQEVR